MSKQLNTQSSDKIICKVNYNGQGIPYRIYIKTNDFKYFEKIKGQIILFFGEKEHYKTLPGSFFDTCRHIDGAYETKAENRPNRLIEWLKKYKIKCVEIDVIEEFRIYKLTKIECTITKK